MNGYTPNNEYQRGGGDVQRTLRVHRTGGLLALHGELLVSERQGHPLH
jgi:hypothetical protein